MADVKCDQFMVKRPTVLVTGGTGFIGGRLAVALQERGYGVRVHHRPGDDTRLIDGRNIERIEGDICDPDSLMTAAKGCTGVFHTAGNVSFRRRDKSVQHRVNVDGTRTVLETCRRARVRRLVHTSTVNALGIPSPRGSVGNEETTFDFDSCRFGYALTKKLAEDIALGANRRELDVVVVNPGTVFGPGDINRNAGSYILALARMPVLVCPTGGTNCVHIDNVVEGHIAAYERGKPGERYILGGENLTYRQVFSTIADVLGRRRPVLALPTGPGILAAATIELISDLSGIDTRLSAEAARAGGRKFFFSSEKARRELGIEPIPFRRAVEEAVEWYRREGFL